MFVYSCCGWGCPSHVGHCSFKETPSNGDQLEVVDINQNKKRPNINYLLVTISSWQKWCIRIRPPHLESNPVQEKWEGNGGNWRLIAIQDMWSPTYDHEPKPWKWASLLQGKNIIPNVVAIIVNITKMYPLPVIKSECEKSSMKYRQSHIITLLWLWIMLCQTIWNPKFKNPLFGQESVPNQR